MSIKLKEAPAEAAQDEPHLDTKLKPEIPDGIDWSDTSLPSPEVLRSGLTGSELVHELYPEDRVESLLMEEHEGHPFSHRDIKQELDALLGYWKIQPDPSLFSPDGVALIANLVNLTSKTDYDVYWLKDELCYWLTKNHSQAHYSADEGCLYVDTLVGQVSFHLPSCEHLMPLTGGEPRWSGIEVQFDAPELLKQFVSINRSRDSELAEYEFEDWWKKR